VAPHRDEHEASGGDPTVCSGARRWRVATSRWTLAAVQPRRSRRFTPLVAVGMHTPMAGAFISLVLFPDKCVINVSAMPD
jgi:hypothetical protein